MTQNISTKPGLDTTLAPLEGATTTTPPDASNNAGNGTQSMDQWVADGGPIKSAGPLGAPPPVGAAGRFAATPPAGGTGRTELKVGPDEYTGEALIEVTDFSNKQDGLRQINQAYQQAIKRGLPVVVVHGDTSCSACHHMAQRLASQHGGEVTVIYINETYDKQNRLPLSNLSSRPVITTLPANPSLKFTGGETNYVDKQGNGIGYTRISFKGAQYVPNPEVGDKRLTYTQQVLDSARTQPVAPQLRRGQAAPVPSSSSQPATPGPDQSQGAAPQSGATSPAGNHKPWERSVPITERQLRLYFRQEYPEASVTSAHKGKDRGLAVDYDRDGRFDEFYTIIDGTVTDMTTHCTGVEADE